MIILDTNVLSGLMQQQPDPQVVAWLDGQSAQLAAKRKACGRPVDMRDTFIAGIVLAHNAILATRNIHHCSDLSVSVVNPWDWQA
ncbi:MAG: type II toxin-antitoxin system VapC family toxin [Chlorobium sp.]|nr:MAG: type II toxin-antitoxin system VapC family toxin [Chlorobium sp.]